MLAARACPVSLWLRSLVLVSLRRVPLLQSLTLSSLCSLRSRAVRCAQPSLPSSPHFTMVLETFMASSGKGQTNNEQERGERAATRVCASLTGALTPLSCCARCVRCVLACSAKVLNVLFFVFSFLAWVCCWVSFTGVLQTVAIAGAGSDGGDLKGNFWSATHRTQARTQRVCG